MPNASKFLNNGLSSEEDEQEEEDLIVEMESDDEEQIPPSKWDNTNSSFRSNKMNPLAASSPKSAEFTSQWSLGDRSFQRFIREVLAASIIILWPESTTLTLPQFLADNGFYDALKNYCKLNEPFISELAYALCFFQAISLSGTNKPEQAWKSFEQVSFGILSNDDTLNNLLDSIIPLERQEMEYEENVRLAAKSRFHTLASIYATLFSQHLIARNYREAIRILLLIPNNKRQTTCLKQLVGSLIEKGETQTLVYLSYEHLTSTVVEILENRCRAEIIGAMQENNSYEIAFAFHIAPAQIIYQMSQRIKQETQNRDFLEKRCRALSVVHQTLQVVNSDNNVIYLNVEKSKDEQALSNNNINLETTNVVTIALTRDDIGRELMKSEVRLELFDCDPTTIPSLDEEKLLSDAMKHKRYDMAWLRPYTLLELVTKEAIMTDIETAEEEEEHERKWAISNQQFVMDQKRFVIKIKLRNNYSNYPIHWKIVNSYVKLALCNWPSDARVLRTVAYVFLRYSIDIPEWLETLYKKVHLGDFIQTYVEFGELSKAFALIIPEMDTFVTKTASGKDPNVIVPFTPIFQLIHFAEKSQDKNLVI